MFNFILNKEIEKKILKYCKMNEIEDVNTFTNKCILQGLNIIQFGTSPKDNIERENNGIKDIIENEKSPNENKPSRKNEGKREEERIRKGIQDNGENGEKEEKKEKVKVRKIKVIKKQ